MVPEEETSAELFRDRKEIEEDAALLGYRECATEALEWLLNLGYEPGHPLLRSLAARLTNKPAYLEKIDLRRFLVQDSLARSCEPFSSRFHADQSLERALTEAAFRGCDLRYRSHSP